jgi:ATP-dependent Lhr-like helicase
VDRHSSAGAGVDRLREVLVPLQGLALPVEIWERDVLPRRIGAYSQTWLDSLCASGEVVWVGAGSIGRSSGRVALYFREDAPLIGAPPALRGGSASSTNVRERSEIDQLRERLAHGPAFFTDLLVELDIAGETLREALWDLVWAGEATNDAWAPLRAPHLTLARGGRASRGGESPLAGFGVAIGPTAGRSMAGRSRFGTRRRGAQTQVQGRWSLTASLFGELPDRHPAASPSSGSPSTPLPSPERRRAIAELLLERYGIVTREQVLAEGIRGGFALLYDSFAKLETLGMCRRGYFIEGMGGAQFALAGAVERLRAGRSSLAQAADAPSHRDDRSGARAHTLVLAAADPAQPYGAALPWPKREGQTRRPARVAGAYVVMVEDEPVLYVERGGRGLVTLGGLSGAHSPAGAPAGAGGVEEALAAALAALAEAVRAGRVGKLALERIDGEPAIASALAQELIELGFHSGPRKLTLSA